MFAIRECTKKDSWLETIERQCFPVGRRHGLEYLNTIMGFPNYRCLAFLRCDEDAVRNLAYEYYENRLRIGMSPDADADWRGAVRDLGEPIGFLVYRIIHDQELQPILHLERVCVERRGQGHGREFLRLHESAVRLTSPDVRRIQLYVEPTDPVQEFFKKAGYTDIPSPADALFMERRIA